MIGKAYPFEDTGYSIVEEGVIQEGSLELKVNKYFLVDTHGNLVGEASDMPEAKDKLKSIIETS